MWILAALGAAAAFLVRRFALSTPVLLVAALGVAVSQTIVVAALPVFARQLEVSAAAAAWLLTGFMVAAAVATPIAGRLGDLHGYLPVMIASLVLLVLGSVLAAVADHAGSFAGLLLGRVVQGLSGGVFPVAFGLARRIVAPNRLPGVVAALSAMVGVGGALGMVLAGPLVDVLGTAGLPLLSVGLGLVALAGAAGVREPDVRAPAGALDVVGAALLSGVLVAVLIVVSQGRTWGAAATVAVAVAAVVGAIAFVRVELVAPTPMIDLRLLCGRSVAATNVATVVVSIGMFAAVMLIPLFAQTPPAAGYGFGATAAGTGLLIAPIAVAMVVAAPLGARLTARMGGRATFQTGAVLAAAALAAMAYAHEARWQFVAGGAVLGLAYGLAFASLGGLVVDAVRPEETGAATGINTILRTVGGAIGAQIAAAIVTGSASSTGVPTEAGFVAAFGVAACVALLAVIAAAAIPRSARRAVLVQ